jgi:hypothetical protein
VVGCKSGPDGLNHATLIKTIFIYFIYLPKVSYEQLTVLRRGRCRLPPPDADRERARPAFQNGQTLSVRRAPMPTVYK